MAWAHLQSQFNDDIGSGSGQAFASSVTVDSLLLVALVSTITGSPTVASSQGGNYTPIGSVVGDSTSGFLTLFYRYATASSGETITPTLSGASFDLILMEYSGLGGAPEDSAAADGADTEAASGVATASTASGLAVAIVTNNDTQSTPGDGYAGRAQGVATFFVTSQDKTTAIGEENATSGNSLGHWAAALALFLEPVPPTPQQSPIRPLTLRPRPFWPGIAR
jgi:hypothetical protein